MSEYVKLATGAGDLYLAALAEFQETVLKSMTAFSDATPTGPKMPVPPFRGGFSDAARGRRGKLRIHREAAQAAEVLCREVPRHDHAGDEHSLGVATDEAGGS